MKIVPLGDKVVVKRESANGQTRGGIVLPDSAAAQPQQGRVLSVGEGRPLPLGGHAPPQVSEGDRIVFSKWAGTEISIGDDELLILSEDDILAILD